MSVRQSRRHLLCGKCGTKLHQAEDILSSQTKAIETPLMTLTRGRLFAGKYKIIGELGRGGMGIVLNAEDTKLKRIVEEMISHQVKTHASSVSIAWGLAIPGDFDRAFEYFDKAYEERDTLMCVLHIYTDFLVPELMREPRYKALLKRLNLDS